FSCPWSLTNRDKNELSPSDEAPPRIHNNRELNEFSEAGLGAASLCCEADAGICWRGLPTIPALLVSDVT
ncbi:hypothetical protein FRX31_022777, partial [Thalictrum thalictroides]